MMRGKFLAGLLCCSNLLSAETILHCGVSTGDGFNGWYITPYDSFTSVVFTEETIIFNAENGGDYTIVLTRKIANMPEYDEVTLSLGLNALHNCRLNGIDVAISLDGKTWKNLVTDQYKQTTRFNMDMDYKYLRISAGVSFFKDGFFECGYLKLDGKNPGQVADVVPEQEVSPEFFVFCFNKVINVETKCTEPYDIVFTNLTGQVVYSESATGSTRVESGLPDGVYLVSVIRNKQVIHTKKVVFSS